MECKEPGCKEEIYSRNMCKRHYNQWQRLGYTLTRSNQDSNEIKIKDNYALIYLYNRAGEVIYKARIDLLDIALVKDIRWSYHKTGYAHNSNIGMLHNFIMHAQDGQMYDHKNTKRLDCRRKNLRLCTYQDNSRNRSIASNNSSGAKGVCWHKKIAKYQAYLQIDRKSKHLGYFDDLIEAARAYNKAARELFGEFAKLNNIKRLRESLA